MVRFDLNDLTTEVLGELEGELLGEKRRVFADAVFSRTRHPATSCRPWPRASKIRFDAGQMSAARLVPWARRRICGSGMGTARSPCRTASSTGGTIGVPNVSRQEWLVAGTNIRAGTRTFGVRTQCFRRRNRNAAISQLGCRRLGRRFEGQAGNGCASGHLDAVEAADAKLVGGSNGVYTRRQGREPKLT